MCSRNDSAMPDCFPNSSDIRVHGNKVMVGRNDYGRWEMRLYLYTYIYGLLITFRKSWCPNHVAITFIWWFREVSPCLIWKRRCYFMTLKRPWGFNSYYNYPLKINCLQCSGFAFKDTGLHLWERLQWLQKIKSRFSCSHYYYCCTACSFSLRQAVVVTEKSSIKIGRTE